MQEEKISLYCKNDRSDKVYHVQLEKQGDGFWVKAQNGPRGGTLSAARKPIEAVPYAIAKKDYDALVKSKLKTGYSPGEAGSAFVGGELEARFTGIVPQLSNLIGPEEVEQYLKSPDWVLQEKFDGHRRLTRNPDTGLIGINRRGLVTGLPQPVVAAHSVLAADSSFGVSTLDGELMGDVMVLFDVLEHDGMSLRSRPYSERLAVLEKLKAQLEKSGASEMFGIHTARTEAEKRKLYAALIENSAEGGVFKRLDSVFEEGRPVKGGNHLKRKFTHRATFIVTKLHASKRSMSFSGLDAVGNLVALGNCIYLKAVPKVGDLWEIEYLYAYRGGSLCQPQDKGPRDDIERAACTLTQLHYKAAATGTSEDAEEDTEVALS